MTATDPVQRLRNAVATVNVNCDSSPWQKDVDDYELFKAARALLDALPTMLSAEYQRGKRSMPLPPVNPLLVATVDDEPLEPLA